MDLLTLGCSGSITCTLLQLAFVVILWMIMRNVIRRCIKLRKISVTLSKIISSYNTSNESTPNAQ